MSKVTNYIIKSTNVGFTERYILPEYRKRMKQIYDYEEAHNYEPLLVIGNDGLWWNDYLPFPLDRMSGGKCGEGDTLYDWAKEIEKNPLHNGEIREIVVNGETYSLTADDTDLSNDGLVTNNCAVIENQPTNDELNAQVMRIVHIYNIEWDTDDDNLCGLPIKLSVWFNCAITDMDDTISDWLTSTFNFCHKGFDYEIV